MTIFARQLVHRTAGGVPEVRRGGAGQDDLDANVPVGKLLVEGLAESQHKGFRARHRRRSGFLARSATAEEMLMIVPPPRATNAGMMAYVSRVSAVTFSSIIASMSSTFDSSSDTSAPTPALLTSIVMPVSVESSVSMRLRSALSFRSAATGLNVAAGRTGDTLRHVVQLVLAACHEDEVVAATRQAIGIDSANSGGGAGDYRDTLWGSSSLSFSCSFCVAWRRMGSSRRTRLGPPISESRPRAIAPAGHMAWRSGRKAVRSSSEKTSGCSQAAKWPPLGSLL